MQGYAVNVSNNVNHEKMLEGFFIVEDTSSNLITSFYETINGTTDFSNNIIYSTEGKTPLGYTSDGIAIYSYDENGITTKFDNGYKENWGNLFDDYGLVLNSQSGTTLFLKSDTNGGLLQYYDGSNNLVNNSVTYLIKPVYTSEQQLAEHKKTALDAMIKILKHMNTVFMQTIEKEKEKENT
jgi:hypothetical protein